MRGLKRARGRQALRETDSLRAGRRTMTVTFNLKLLFKKTEQRRDGYILNTEYSYIMLCNIAMLNSQRSYVFQKPQVACCCSLKNSTPIEDQIHTFTLITTTIRPVAHRRRHHLPERLATLKPITSRGSPGISYGGTTAVLYIDDRLTC